MDCLNDNKKGGGAVAVAFDMDGLMFETESVYWKSADILLGRRGHKYTQELCDATMGRPPECAFRLFIERFAFPEDWRTLQRESEDIFIELLKDGLVKGTISPFDGELRSREGVVKTAGSDRLTYEEILSINWLNENVDGEIPPAWEMNDSAKKSVSVAGVKK